MAQFLFMDGAETIGGTKLLLIDEDVRLLFDFGCNYPAEGNFFRYDPTVKKYFTSFERRFYQMRQLQLLPDIPDSEAAYFIRHVKNERQYDLLPDPHIHGLLLTHAHHDHDGNIPFLSPKIPLFATPESLSFYEQKNIQSWAGKDGQPKNRYKNNEHWRKRMAGHYALDEARPVTFLDKTRVTPIRVDHSIPGACGFLIETSDGKTIALSGDFRLHGTNERRALSERFIEVVRERGPVDLLIIEGTNIDEYSTVQEEARSGWSIKEFIKAEAELAFEREAMVVIGVSGNNIERIDSIYEIVCELDARLHLSVYNAAALERLRQTERFPARRHVTSNLLDAKHVAIYERYAREFSKKFSGDIDQPYAHHAIADYGRDPAVQHRAVMLLYDGDLGLLTQIKPLPGSKYIRSAWEPFNDEQKPDHARLNAWLERFGLSYHHIHASGHAYASQLKEAIVAMRPKRVAPIHTLKPELFMDALPAERVLLVRNGEVVEI